MPEFVMHQKLDGTDREIVVIASDESDLTAGTSPQEASGWRLKKAADPEKVRAEALKNDPEPAEPVNPRIKE